MAITGVPQPGRAPGRGSGGTSGMGPGLSQTLSPPDACCWIHGAPSAVLHPRSAHAGGSFLAQGFLMYMLLSSWSPPNLEFTLEGIKRIHTVVQASPLCNSELYSHPKRRALGTLLPSSRSPRRSSHVLPVRMCLRWAFHLRGVYSMWPFVSGWFHSAQCPHGPSSMKHVSALHSFLWLNAVPWPGFTGLWILCPPISAWTLGLVRAVGSRAPYS